MQTYDLTEGNVPRLLLGQALPMIWGIFAVISMNLADTYFVGQLGTDELAAMGFTFPIVMIMSSVAFGIGIGASSLVSRAIGSKKLDEVRGYTTSSILIALGIAIILAIIGISTIDPVFRLLGAPDSVLPLIHDYMNIWYLGSFLIVVPMVGNSAIRAAGNTKLPSYIMIGIAIVNVILDPILIFGWFGFPAMALKGAALATIISFSVAFMASIYVLRFKLDFLALEHCYHRIWPRWKAILRLAIPAAASNIISPLSIAVTTWLVASYSSDAVAGYGIAARVESFMLIMLMALSAVLAPFSGQNWGANKLDRLQEAIKFGYRFSWIWGIGVAALLWLTSDYLLSAFTDNEAALNSAKSYLMIVSLTFCFLGMVMMTNSVANGIGNPIPALVFTFSRLLVLYLPLVYVLSNAFGLQGIYVATAASNMLVGIAAWYWSSKKCRAEIITENVS
ncbi:MATE family efflux transporter [Cocleimonas sp. KMM 6892]|uniref:MATE family efflux transporter n=1 Tax=unclassified Cocleimonas TaxID=2639732 RepID=UPI002DB83346|nr:MULTISPECIES: MATE family efflux transporter [unclassified Cocleimonas]MEB8430826.1 MATE family efflux transporter [Cocleimonas sp. KMM 6892]MEC4714402.1 MATE family efflux transporter [Cocleimonas sp. KMM 6895]MEC4743733.1 MATE family efflux transporter [Cocleimonas sp. KMM 6896]